LSLIRHETATADLDHVFDIATLVGLGTICVVNHLKEQKLFKPDSCIKNIPLVLSMLVRFAKCLSVLDASGVMANQ